jgi:hypothetical protein
MAEIRNYTMNFSSGRYAARARHGLTCLRKLAFTEIHCVALAATVAGEC